MTTHSKEFALDDYEFENLIRGVYRIEDDLRHLEAMFAVYLAGRLGLRLGEITHIEEGWINWRDRRVEVPYQADCTKGASGGLCGLCRQQARQRAKYSKISLAEARLEALQNQLGDVPNLPGEIQQQMQIAHLTHIDSNLSKEALDRQITQMLENASMVEDADEVRNALDEVARQYKSDVEVSLEEAKDEMWSAKTENAARSVPFGWNPSVEISIEKFFDRFGRWERSHTAVRRRIDKALEYADGLDEDSTTPHGLRATAATHLAGKGLSAPALQSYLGWSQISTARRYITSSPSNTARQLEQTNTR